MNDDIELLHFNFSHYNEKARWALDWKGIPHTRTSYLPGLHMKSITKLTGQSQTPVVRFGDKYIAGSADIIDTLEERFPEPPLYPADPALRTRALEIQDQFDKDTGPRIRRPGLEVSLEGGTYLARVFSHNKNLFKRLGYAAMLPAAKSLIRKGNGITGPEAIEDGIRGTQEAFDFVANTRDGDYLVGDTFTVADLTAAAILAPAVDPKGSTMERPHPRPPSVTRWLERWADHPGAAWVRMMYERHRNAP